MFEILLLQLFLHAENTINWNDPNLKMDQTKDSELEAQIFTPKPPAPLEKPSKQPKFKDLEPQELDLKKNK